MFLMLSLHTFKMGTPFLGSENAKLPCASSRRLSALADVNANINLSKSQYLHIARRTPLYFYGSWC